jgi:hypothetical protein
MTAPPPDPAAGGEVALLTDLPAWPALLDRVVRELYLPSFPNEDEREDPEAWTPRLSIHAPAPPQPSTHVFVAGERLREPDPARTLDGFLIVELYRESGCALATYLAVAPHARGRAVARRLVEHAVRALVRDTAAAGRPLRALLAEITDPHWPKAGGAQDFDPFARVEAFVRMGWRATPVPYVQPALGGARERVRHLTLWARALDDGAIASLDADAVCEFLHEFYRALGVARPDDDPDWAAMTRAVRLHAAGTGRLPVEPVGDEAPSLSFGVYGVAVHYVLAGETGPATRRPRSSAIFRSFERDLLAQSFRERPPFYSTVVLLPDELRVLDLVLPNVVAYEAEGSRKWLLLRPDAATSGTTRRRAVRVSASFTVFPSNRGAGAGGHGDAAPSGLGNVTAVLHLALTPDHGREGPGGALPADLTEWDLVTLIKLWEGGEGVDEPGANRLAERVRFARPDGSEEWTLAGLARMAFRERLELEDGRTVRPVGARGSEDPWDACVARPRVGTVQLITGEASRPKDWTALYRTLAARFGREGVDAPAANGDEDDGGALDRQVGAVAGVLQGLLDFRYIGADELSDVFQSTPGLVPARPSVRLVEGLVMGVHKGTLLSVMEDCRVYRRVHAQVGISPYLILPHAVLLCNAHLLRVAEDAARDALAEPAAATEATMREALQGRYLVNVFHYPLERNLFEAGVASRGLGDLKAGLESQLAEISGQRVAARERRQRRFERELTQIGIAFAALQLLSFFSLLDVAFDGAFLGGLVDRLGLRNLAWLGFVRVLGPIAVFALVLVGLLVVRLRHPDE